MDQETSSGPLEWRSIAIQRRLLVRPIHVYGAVFQDCLNAGHCILKQMRLESDIHYTKRLEISQEV